MQAVEVTIRNPVSGFSREVSTDAAGLYAFRNLPPNPYRLAVVVQGFQSIERDVDVRSAVPITLDLTLNVATAITAIDVVGHAEALLERNPSAHTDVDQTTSTSCRSGRLVDSIRS